MKQKPLHAFTIVELLIVIVVIAILAAISIVAYNGIQTRAKNVKTANAAVAWVKAIKLYNADKGYMPSSTSSTCLGSGSSYVGDSAQCWNGYTVSASFLTSMQPYMSNSPEPDTTNVSTLPEIRKGLLYYVSGGNYTLYMLQIGSGSCPGIGVPYTTTGSYSNGYYCQYNLTP